MSFIFDDMTIFSEFIYTKLLYVGTPCRKIYYNPMLLYQAIHFLELYSTAVSIMEDNKT